MEIVEDVSIHIETEFSWRSLISNRIAFLRVLINTLYGSL